MQPPSSPSSTARCKRTWTDRKEDNDEDATVLKRAKSSECPQSLQGRKVTALDGDQCLGQGSQSEKVNFEKVNIVRQIGLQSMPATPPIGSGIKTSLSIGRSSLPEDTFSPLPNGQALYSPPPWEEESVPPTPTASNTAAPADVETSLSTKTNFLPGDSFSPLPAAQNLYSPSPWKEENVPPTQPASNSTAPADVEASLSTKKSSLPEDTFSPLPNAQALYSPSPWEEENVPPTQPASNSAAPSEVETSIKL